jgi:Cu/Ag efflux protein CusF
MPLLAPNPTIYIVKTPTLLIALLITFFSSIAQPAAALTPRGRPITGTIQKVDTQSREVALLREDKGTVITFVWVSRTTFVADAKMADANILKKGARVEVSHHVPFFGKPFVTRVTLLPVLASNKSK